MAYSNFYVNYEKSDKKESDYINKEDKEEKKDAPKKDVSVQRFYIAPVASNTSKYYRIKIIT
jgi:hypothetical protein